MHANHKDCVSGFFHVSHQFSSESSAAKTNATICHNPLSKNKDVEYTYTLRYTYIIYCKQQSSLLLYTLHVCISW